MTYKPLELLRFDNNLLKLAYLGSRFSTFQYWVMKALRPLYVNRETALNRTLRWPMLTLGAGLLPPEELKTYRFGLKAFIENFSAAIAASEKGDPIVWVEWILSSEIIGAFDVASFNPEVLNVFGNVNGGQFPPLLIEEAENKGVPIEYCSAIKLTIGSYLLKQIPQPSLIIAASHPCDTSVSAYQILEHITGAPTYVFDCPYWDDEDSFNYYEKNMWKLIEFLEAHLGRKINWDKLREVLQNVNKFNYYLQEISEMMKAVPSPGTMITLLYAWVVREAAIGSPHAAKMAEEMYKVVKGRFEKGIGVVKNEKIRVLWWNPPIAFFTYIFKWMEHEFGAVVVSDFIGKVTMPQIDTTSNQTMVQGLAKAHLYLAMGRQCRGPAEFITSELERAIHEYSPDCMIFAGHSGCKHGWGAIKIVQDVCRREKLPSLYMNIDIMDQRHANEDEIKRQISQFFRGNGFA
jgi:benzoyl-CoA reductase/2-hydroxyglutaryl-CoA dehydratase subunit BcrC/BadD/HgdB